MEFPDGGKLEYSSAILKVVKALDEGLDLSTNGEILIDHEDFDLSKDKTTQILKKLQSLPTGIKNTQICRNGLVFIENGIEFSACGNEHEPQDFNRKKEDAPGCDRHIINVSDKTKLKKFIDDYISLSEFNKNGSISKGRFPRLLFSGKNNKSLARIYELLSSDKQIENFYLAKCLTGHSKLTKNDYEKPQSKNFYNNKIKNCLRTIKERLKMSGYTVKYSKKISYIP